MAQLKSTNITGNFAVTGNTLASKIIKLGGTNDDILMGDGSTTSKQALIDSLEAAMEGDTNTWREIKVNGTSILGTGIDSGSLNLAAGTNVSISNSGGTVTISSSYTDTDTGATSIEVTGTGNAVTSASYDATTRKITLTKGSTFLTSHQSLAAYVKGPSSSTDTAIALFNGTGGKTIKNSGLTVDASGNLSGVGTLNCGGIKLVTESQPTILASQLGSAITVEGIETPVIYAPTTSGGTTFGVGTNGQVLKSNGTTVYWGTDNSGSGGLTSLPTRLADYSTTGYGDANEATAQGWHYMTTTATNRPPFKQSANKDYRIMSTAYSAA